MTELFPCAIKNHLAKFLFQEFTGKEANINCVKAKAVIIDIESHFGFFLYSAIRKHQDLKDIDSFALFIRTIHEQDPLKRQVESHLYNYKKGKVDDYDLLMLESKAVKSVNQVIQFFFDISIFNYISNTLSEMAMQAAILEFLAKYDLLDDTVNPETIRRRYYRMRNDKLLDRLNKK